jgi:Recombinase zinc beta ribbon domain
MSGIGSMRNKDGSRRRYYRCHHRARNGAHTCPNGKYHRAEKIEAEAWAKLSELLKDPERLRIGVDRMMEERKGALREDPAHVSKHWRGELEKIERMRSGYLDQQAEGLITMAELKGKLAALDERRSVAERELEGIAHHQEYLAELERGFEELAALYREQAREGLDLYTPQDRHDAYKSLGIHFIAHPDGSVELNGSVLMGIRSDKVCSKPSERSQAPLSTETRRPPSTLTPPRESR